MKLISCNPGEGFEIIADSALVLPGRPTFIPDLPDAESWVAELLIAARISRLGKSISPKFAHRFHDCITLVARLVPIGNDGSRIKGIMSAMDFGVTLGEWIDRPQPDNRNIEITFAGEKFPLENLTEQINSAIVNLSRFSTLKMGDVLLLPASVNPVKATIGNDIAGAIDGRQVLEVRFK